MMKLEDDKGVKGLWNQMVTMYGDTFPEGQLPPVRRRREDMKMWEHTWVAVVFRALRRFGLEQLFWAGPPRGMDVKDVKPRVHQVASRMWQEAMAKLPSVARHYLALVGASTELKCRDYLKVCKNPEARVIHTLMRAGRHALREQRDFRALVEVVHDDRWCLMPNCGHEKEVEDPFHFYIQCGRWERQRRQFELNVIDCRRLSDVMKNYLGRLVDNQLRWYGVMMCCDLGEPLGEMYRKPIGELKVILTRASRGEEEFVLQAAAARGALRDRLGLQELWDEAVVPWYRERMRVGGVERRYGGYGT